MQPLPATIKKSVIGYFFILLVGLALISLVVAGVYSMWRTGDLDEGLFYVSGFFIIVILLITIIQLWVYSLSFIELTVDGLHVVNWRTLFVKTDVTTTWDKVQDVTVTTSSAWSLIFAYGTLFIQTAGTAQDLNMTMVPEPEYWQAVIQGLADSQP